MAEATPAASGCDADGAARDIPGSPHVSRIRKAPRTRLSTRGPRGRGLIARDPVKPLARESVCVVAILRDELPFLHEWLSYHRILGVDHFILYDDDPALPLKAFVAPHASYVTVVDWHGKSSAMPGRNRQTKA